MSKLHYILIDLEFSPKRVRLEKDTIEQGHFNCYTGSRYNFEMVELWAFSTWHQVMVF